MKNTATEFETGMAPFKLIDVSGISPKDEFLSYEPFFNVARMFKKDIIEALETEPTKKFYISMLDPAETEDGNGICFCRGMKPAIGYSFNWWKKAAADYLPTYGSKICTKTEYLLFCAYLMKKLAERWDLEELWLAMIQNSAKLGNYLMEGIKPKLLNTGSHKVDEFYDLANTIKYLASDHYEADYYIAAGSYSDPSNTACVGQVYRCYCPDNPIKNAVGKIVIPK